MFMHKVGRPVQNRIDKTVSSGRLASTNVVLTAPASTAPASTASVLTTLAPSLQETITTQPQEAPSAQHTKKTQPYWFCDYIGFEEKQSRANRLIMDFRRWSPERNGSITTTVYFREPVTLSSEFIYGLENLEERIDEFKRDPELSRCKMKVFLATQLKSHLEALKQKYPDIEFLFAKNRYSVINADIPYDVSLLEKLSKKWQKGNYNKQARSKLDCLYKKVHMDARLGSALAKVDQLRRFQEEVRKIAEQIIKEDVGPEYDPRDKRVLSARTRLENAINKFFEAYKGELNTDAVLSALRASTAKEFSPLRRLADDPEKNQQLCQIIGIKLKANGMLSETNSFVKQLDPENEVRFNLESGEYELTLTSRQWFDFQERLTIDEIRQQVFCYVDIEKPMWKNKREKAAIYRRKMLLAYVGAIEKAVNEGKKTRGQGFLIKLNGTQTGSKPKLKGLNTLSEEELIGYRQVLLDKISRARDVVARLEQRLTINVEGVGIVQLWEERYDAKISQVVITFKLEDGSLVRQYHKIKHNANYSPKEINGFPVFEHKDEHSLLTSIVEASMGYRPFANVAHVITYDMPQLREGTRTNKTDRFDIIIPDKEPSLAYARDFYRKMAQTGQEMFDTCMLGRTAFPYLRIKAMDSSHRLVDMINYVRSLKYGDDFVPFEKIATHTELRFLEIRRMHGYVGEDIKMDEYTTGDSAPMEELMDFFLPYVDKVSRILPHVTLTDVAFSPGCMEEILRKKHWVESHNQQLFGYKQKERHDEIQIFNKRDPSYHKRKLQAEGINTAPIYGMHRNVYLVHIPRAEWLKSVVLLRYPELKTFYDGLGLEPIMKAGLLQYMNKFLRQSYLPDYYRYRRESDIEWQYRQRFGVKREGDSVDVEINSLFIKYRLAADRRMPGLADKYYASYDQVKNLFRSFYTSLDALYSKQQKEKIRKLLRVRGGKREMRDDTQPTFDFYNTFYEENKDLMVLHKLHELPQELQITLPERSLRLFNRYQSTFKTLVAAFKDLQKIADEELGETIIDRFAMTKENLVYFYNQHLRAEKKRREFIAKYGVLPETPQTGPDSRRTSFKDTVDAGYKRLAQEIVEKKLIVVAQRGDYLFVKTPDGREIDFTGTTMLPIRRFDTFTEASASLSPEDEEIAELFGEDDYYSDSGLGESQPGDGEEKSGELIPAA
jgi:hypothetical protein